MISRSYSPSGRRGRTSSSDMYSAQSESTPTVHAADRFIPRRVPRKLCIIEPFSVESWGRGSANCSGQRPCRRLCKWLLDQNLAAWPVATAAVVDKAVDMALAQDIVVGMARAVADRSGPPPCHQSYKLVRPLGTRIALKLGTRALPQP